MKVLVTGASGFIGRYLIMELLQNNCEIIATSIEQNIDIFTWHKQVKYIQFDLNNFEPSVDYYKMFDYPDLMIHLAWEGLPNYKKLYHFEENLPRHYRLIKNLIINGLKDITVTGTCFEYGMQEGCLNEDMPSIPSNPYALAKDTLRKFLQEFQKTQPFNFKWTRLFYMYGKGQSPFSFFSQMDRAIENQNKEFKMSGGEQLRDYLPVEEVAAKILKIAFQTKISGIINCCSGQPNTLKELAINYLKSNNKTIKLKFGFYPYSDIEPMHFWGDITKLNKIIDND